VTGVEGYKSWPYGNRFARRFKTYAYSLNEFDGIWRPPPACLGRGRQLEQSRILAEQA
jgi:hypothetical protein